MAVCCYAGILPRAVRACRSNKRFLSLLNCFSAGIFVGMSLVHILPEADEIFTEWAEENGYEKPFPVPYVLVFVGYVLILIVDRVISAKYYYKNIHLNKSLNLTVI